MRPWSRSSSRNPPGRRKPLRPFFFPMLQLCHDGHDELCHDGECPACAALAKLRDSDEQCAATLAELDELKSEVRDLREKLEQLKA